MTHDLDYSLYFANANIIIDTGTVLFRGSQDSDPDRDVHSVTVC